MAKKLTRREIWAIIKDEPLYRLGAFVIAVSFLIYAGVQLSPFWGIWRLAADQWPRPPVEGVYHVGDDCFSFTDLPKGWRPARQDLNGQEISIERREHGFQVVATLVPYNDDPHTGESGIGDLNYYGEFARRDVGGYIHCSADVNFGWRPDDKRCVAEDQSQPGKYGVRVLYKNYDKKYAEPLLAEANIVLRATVKACGSDRPASEG